MTAQVGQSIPAILERIQHWLPSQGALKEFVHHNTLHAFQHFPFFEGCLRASRLYGSRAFLEHQPQASVLQLRQRWKERGVAGLERRTHPVLFRLAGQFLDQGISIWRMPHAHTGFFQAVGQLVRESWLPLVPFSRQGIREYFAISPEEVITRILEQLLGNMRFAEAYLLETSLAHPGWSGVISRLQAEPGQLVVRRQIRLADFLALELMAELAVIEEHLGRDFVPLIESHELPPELPCDPDYRLQWTPEEKALRQAQIEREQQWRSPVLDQIRRQPPMPEGPVPEVQAFFCIDDRECSIRRHLERIHPALETFGFAGFFGVDCMFQGADDAFAFKHCPQPVQPHHLIREIPRKTNDRRRLHLPFEGDGDSHTLIRGFLISQTVGLWAALKLAFSLFRPSMSPLTASSLRRVDGQAELQVSCCSDETCEGCQVGYSDAEMADRVGNLLRATGALRRGLSRLVVLFGHGSSSVNNPYFAAYDCGACSGKAGAPNARAFALMANRPEVRALLAARGQALPEDTWFVGALHDTTRDEVQYYDVEQLPATQRQRFEDFRRSMEVALGRNAQERCEKLPMAARGLSEKDALVEVRRRSISLFETRPELNHAGNAACIVGRRTRTRELFLDRRAFLNSYDPRVDTNGDILCAILNAVVPVCGGINLEYYFSRLDPQKYGAGSKLPHNINGLIGVMNGTEGDLLTGLPTQMTELHEPLRLLLLVEQFPEVALAAARRNPAVYEWIENEWLAYAALDPEGSRLWRFHQGKMVEVA